ncbi:MAG: acyltransferase [Oscillospiraceae bacterium]|nr:acyltransferase [Oscillospiraceae bacterium]
MEKKRLHFIDGYKGLLCLMIMVGHFWNIYRLTSGASPLDHRVLDAFNEWGSKWVLVATVWLYAFMAISGYLLSFSKIKSTPDLLTKSVSRFLRLFIPILGACLIIFGISKVVGFYAGDTAEFFKNTWFQKYYKKAFVFADVFKQSWRAMFDGACAFNSPFWVIKDMLLASVLIYVCKLVDHTYQKKTHWLPLLLTLCFLLLDNQVATACFAGFLIGYYDEELRVLTAKFWTFLVVSAVIYFAFTWLSEAKVCPSVIDKVTGYTLIHCFLLITLNRFSILQKIFSAKPFLLVGKISFGIYAFHWPVICSVGSWMLIRGIKQNWHPVLTLGTAFLVSLGATVVLAIGYYFTVEKFGDFTVKQVRKLGGLLEKEK